MFPLDRYRFYFRPHRLLRSWRDPLPANASRRVLLDSFAPGGDLFHGLNQRLPRRRPQRTVTTFHDLFVLSGDYSTPEFRERFAAQARDAASRSDRLIAVSQFTAHQMTELLGIEPARISVIHHGVRIQGGAARKQPVILHVGAIQRRKNVARLVRAFRAVRPPWRLVLAGSAGYGAEEAIEEVNRSPERDRIEVTGWVDDERLRELYATASVLAFASLDEGFGMPILEAMASGAAVVSSNRSAMPEVCGDAALLVDPLDEEQLAGALRTMTEDDGERELLAAAGRRRAAQFSWETAVRQTRDVYRQVSGG